ncbi:polyprenyl synthetase family protein [Nonomuraea sp. NBC_01738]|uniref:polyprenyl synthetase family protein n=1 Tax=Nonomuraea sp. NBC_01738 TaxID=2976003 RepID=UPI002E167F74|nr:polyprenyl synthetase family protein [Nonomuraea sp. NBC_01738]
MLIDTERWLTHQPSAALMGALDGVLEDLLRCREERLTEAAAHLVRRGGKRMRPALLFVSSAFGPGGAETDLLRVAAAVELLHVAALYHDDVMDRAETRRGTPTVNAVRGDAEAVTAGTFVFARAMRTLAAVDGTLAAWASRSVLALALGQMQEAENTYNLEHRLESYAEIAARKTAALFELSCRAGARLAGAPQDAVEGLGLYGRALGLAFQAADDTLDVTAPEAVLGKKPGTDLREGVYGLPVLLVLHRRTLEAERLRQVLRRDDFTEDDQEEACHHVQAGGGIAGAFTIAQDYAHQAVTHIAGLPGGEAKDSLARLARYVVTRRH